MMMTRIPRDLALLVAAVLCLLNSSPQQVSAVQYIQYGERAQQGSELFDVKADPKQYTNLARRKSHQQVVARFQAKIAAKMKALRNNDLPKPQRRAKKRARKLVIAHRGASGYLPEHTLAAAAAACVMRADYVEQDVVLTRDNHPIVIHDKTLERVTDVATVFPQRSRGDGHYYAIDFSLAEIRRLTVTERVRASTGKNKRSAVFPRRFPVGRSKLRISTLGEHIELIHGMNKTLRTTAGVYVEIKHPAWHRKQGKDLSAIVLATLHKYGYRNKGAKAYVQCFDAAELKRIRRSGCKLKLIQLIGENSWKLNGTDFDKLRTPAGLKSIARYADGIGPNIKHVISQDKATRRLRKTSLTKQARQVGLEVHPYTARADAIPFSRVTFDELLTALFREAKVDGVFTDFPDRVKRFVGRRGK